MPIRRNSDVTLKRRLWLLLLSATAALGIGVGGLILHVPDKTGPFVPFLALLLLAALGLCLLAAALLLAVGAAVRRCMVARRWRKRRGAKAEKTVNRKWIIYELRQSLRSLAAPGAIALTSCPEGTVKADELALDYEHWMNAALGCCKEEFAETQRTALRKVDDLLTSMSGQHRVELWTEDAVLHHPAWSEVRKAAEEALDVLGWEGLPMTWDEYRRDVRTRGGKR